MGNSRDIIEQNDALPPGHVVDVPDFGISGTHEIAEDRRESSEPDASRRFFDKVAGIIARYSVNTETTDFKTILELLKKEIKDLSNIDAIIPLLRSTKNTEWSPEKGDKRVVTWQIVNPTIKDLNDYHLLPSQTDDFMAELHKEIENVFVELGTNAAKMLKTHFKGGVFLVDLERIQDNETTDEQAAITIFNNKISQLRPKAREILLKHLHFRLKKLEKLKSLTHLSTKLTIKEWQKVLKKSRFSWKKLNRAKQAST